MKVPDTHEDHQSSDGRLDLGTFKGRVSAHMHRLFSDHGALRELVYSNFHRLSEKGFRSSQPSPRQIRSMVKRYGIRTVVNLRGYNPTLPPLILEEETCKELGVHMVSFRILSRSLPTREKLRAAKELMETIEYPAVFHCKSGADRSGIMSTLFLHWIEQVPLEEIHQLNFFPYLHIRYGKTGFLDFFFKSYLSYAREHPMDLMTWVDTVYDPEQLKQQFKPGPLMDILIDKLFRRE